MKHECTSLMSESVQGMEMNGNNGEVTGNMTGVGCRGNPGASWILDLDWLVDCLLPLVGPCRCLEG